MSEDPRRQVAANIAFNAVRYMDEAQLAERVRSAQEQAWNEGAVAGAEFGYMQGRADGGDHPPLADNPYAQGDKQA